MNRLDGVETADVRSAAARLRTIILVDVATASAGTLFVLVVYVTAVRSGYLALAAALVALSGAVMAVGLAPLGRGDIRSAMWWLAGANWSIAIAAATLATFSWPLMMLTALLPCVAGAALLPRREMSVYVAISVVVSLAVVAAGLLQDFSGLSADVPEPVKDVVLIVFAPSLAGLVALMALHNSVSMVRALTASNSSRAELAAQTEELRISRTRLVAATDRERRRIERDLHDGAQQRLIGIGLGLSRIKELCRSDPDRAAASLDALRFELRAAHDELRDLAQGVYPPVLTEHGLEAALQSAADRCALPVTVALRGVGRHPSDVEAALYFCCVEALQNAAKHSRGSAVTVACGADEQELWLSVTDDGVGFDAATGRSGSGILNITDRLGSIGGRLDVAAAPSGGAVVRACVPLTPRS